MKKILSVLMIIIIFTFNSTYIQNEHIVLASETGYLPILQNEVQVNGIYDGEYESEGVVYGRVSDFDINGVDELYIILLSNGMYIEKLYSGDSIVYENELAGPGAGRVSDNSLEIAEGSKGVYIRYSYGYGAGGYETYVTYNSNLTESIYSFSNGSFQELIKLETNETGYDMSQLEYELVETPDMVSDEAKEIFANRNDDTSEYIVTKYLIDGEEVNDTIYQEKTDSYDSLSWEVIINGDAGSNSVAIDSQSIITNLLFDLEENEKPDNLGDDIKNELDKDLYSSMKQWLSYSQHLSDYKIGKPLSDLELFGFMFVPQGSSNALTYEEINDSNATDFPENTYSRQIAKDVDQFLSVYLGQAFTNKEAIIDDEYFPFIKKDNYYYYPDFAMSYDSIIAEDVRNIYKLSENIFYISFTEYDLMDVLYSGELPAIEDMIDTVSHHQIMDQISDEDKKLLNKVSHGFAVMKVDFIDGEYKWTLIERNTSGEKFDESVLEQYKKEPLKPVSIDLKFEEINKYETFDEYIEVIKDHIHDKKLNEQDKSLLSSYISVVLQKLNQTFIDSKNNEIFLTTEELESSILSIEAQKEELNQSLQLEELELTKNLLLVNRFNMNYLDFEKPIKMTLTNELLPLLDTEKFMDQSLYVSLDGSTRGVLIDYEHLKLLLEQHEQITIILTYADKNVQIEFESEKGKKLEKINVTIQVLIPAENQNSTVYLDKEIWGGQFNETNSSLVFEAKHKGIYEVRNNEISLKDINQMSEEQQQALQFLVSRGFFDINNDNFEPSNTINRYDFAKTLVRLFFALDTDAVSSFSDIDVKSPYYKYVASGELNQIINGYDDGTFSGDILIPISHVLSFSGRTLANLKGYQYPASPEDYLQFVDSGNISEELRDEIALSVREGLIDQGGMLEPQRQITRLEAAEILYKLYMLLYEQPVYMLSADVAPPKSFIKENGIVIASGTGLIFVALSGLYLWRRSKVSNRVNVV